MFGLTDVVAPDDDDVRFLLLLRGCRRAHRHNGGKQCQQTSQMLLVMLMVWLPVDRLIRAGGQRPMRIVTIIPIFFGER